MPDQPLSKNWRYPLRVSVRALMILVLVLAAGFGQIVRTERVQHAAVAAIKNAGGSVRYDWELKNGKRIPDAKPWAPQWLVNQIGVDYFGNVVSVILTDTGTDMELAYVGRLRRLERLTLVNCKRMTDTGLAKLIGLTGLRTLRFSTTPVGDAGLAHVRELVHLEHLHLDSALITDEGLANLKGLAGLQDLTIMGARVTDAGLANLEGLTVLKGLNLAHTNVTGVGLAHLTGLTDLQELVLSNNRINDAGLANLESLIKLRRLRLEQTQITDLGLARLSGLASLRELNIRWTKTSEAGVKKLQAILPQAKIVR
jgi:internalin A